MKPTPNVYLMWLGDAEMTPERKECFDHINDNCPFKVHLITSENLSDYLAKDAPLHEGYKYLSATHKFDYLCNYVMCHLGGIVIGIKKTYQWDVWEEYFDKLCSDDNLWLCSARGIGPNGISPACSRGSYQEYRTNWKKIFGHIGWMTKKNTPIVKSFVTENHRVLDVLLPHLEKNPARWSRDSSEDPRTTYKMPWSLLGDGSRYAGALEYNDHVDNSMPKELVDINSHGCSLSHPHHATDQNKL
tara:strand:- start:234 stop:968 length:735 start_codon:yes stop_codon:yes gene_type:complete